MESEIMLLVMLPEKDRVMLVQALRLHTIADLEDFIVDEYSRVFPHVPVLSRDLRIQKYMPPEPVADPRSHTTPHQQAPHIIVDLAKNVQVGNVFKNMEKIYVVLNTKSKKATVEAVRKQHALKKVTAVESNVQSKNYVESSKTAGKEAQDGKKQKERLMSKIPVVEKKPHDTKKKASGNVAEGAKEDIHDSTNDSNDVKKVAVIEAHEKKINLKEKSEKTTKKENHDSKHSAKKDKKSESNTVAGTDENTTKKLLKKIAPKKSKNALLKKMLAAKHNAFQPGAAVVVNSLENSGSGASKKKKVPLKNERKRKASKEDVSLADGNSASDALNHLTKKKKTGKKSDDKMSKLADDEAALAKVEKSGTKTVAQAKVQKTAKKKATTTTKSELINADNSSTNSESTPAIQELKKNIDIKCDDDKDSVMKRAKTEEFPNASVVKKAAEKVKRAAKPVTREIDTSASSISPSCRSTASQEDELTFNEETEVVEIFATEEASKVKSSKKLKEISKPKSDFQKIMADTTKRIADEKKAQLTTTFTPEKRSMQSTKSTESTASESSSDSDQSLVAVKVVKHSRKNATPVEDSSSSSSEEDELGYSQGLLADLTKNDTAEEEVVPVVLKKGKKSKQTGWRSDSDVQTSEQLPSSRLTQKSLESNSVLLPPLSRKRFSLGSMPVAKLKKSSKNPFSSAEKVKAKGKTK